MLALRELDAPRYQELGIPFNTQYASLPISLRWVTSHVLPRGIDENTTSVYLWHFQVALDVQMDLIDDQSDVAVSLQFKVQVC